MKTTTIKQQIIFDAMPSVLYAMLMDEKIHAAFTGAHAAISKRKGGKFSAWNNYITGKNLELKKNKKIVQEWHASDMPSGLISIITFEFVAQTPDTTLLNFRHTAVPEKMAAGFAQGWIDHYWQPMKDYLAR